MVIRKSPYTLPKELPWWKLPAFEWRDPYHWMVTLSWPMFFMIIGVLYIGVNAVFALCYLIQPQSIANARPGSFWDAFFFSLQTISTVGYGSLAPDTFYAHTLVAIEAWVGLLGLALITGLMFARFSLPTARILFSHVALITTFNNQRTLMFRVANQRANRILEAQVRVSLLRREVSLEGIEMHRFYDLHLVRSETPVFGLTWMVMHPITIHSPLWGQSAQDLEQQNVQIFVTLTGLDETVSQTIHAHYSYSLDRLHWNQRFKDVVQFYGNGIRKIDYDRFHEFEPQPPHRLP